jgi:hypothetical protein
MKGEGIFLAINRIIAHSDPWLCSLRYQALLYIDLSDRTKTRSDLHKSHMTETPIWPA